MYVNQVEKKYSPFILISVSNTYSSVQFNRMYHLNLPITFHSPFYLYLTDDCVFFFFRFTLNKTKAITNKDSHSHIKVNMSEKKKHQIIYFTQRNRMS